MEEQALASIRVENVSHSFEVDRRRLSVLERVGFEVPDRAVTAVVGPNGSGKSTLLRIVAGLLKPDDGSITIDSLPVEEADQRIGLVFQEPRLLPWRRAVDNVAFPLELSGVEREERLARAIALLDLMGLGSFARAFPRQLSGGMRQRVAIARALARDPKILLLDEPFSALDALTRERFNAELLDVWERTGTTILIVTHSIPEAIFLADEVIVLSPRPGRMVARVPVALPRPREPAALDSAVFTSTAAAIRRYLAGSPVDLAAEEEAAAPNHDVLERAGRPAWFDPFRSGTNR